MEEQIKIYRIKSRILSINIAKKNKKIYNKKKSVVIKMKKYIIKEFILIMIFVLMIGTQYASLAANTIDTDIRSNTFLDEFSPIKEDVESEEVNAVAGPLSNAVVAVINPILTVIQIIGGFATVISIAFFGFKNLLSAGGGLSKDLGLDEGGNAAEREKIFSSGRRVIIGMVLLFLSVTIVKAVFNVMTGL